MPSSGICRLASLMFIRGNENAVVVLSLETQRYH